MKFKKPSLIIEILQDIYLLFLNKYFVDFTGTFYPAYRLRYAHRLSIWRQDLPLYWKCFIALYRYKLYLIYPCKKNCSVVCITKDDLYKGDYVRWRPINYQYNKRKRLPKTLWLSEFWAVKKSS